MPGIIDNLYIGVGSRRCASSWFHRILDTHPCIHKKKNGGLHFFTDNYSKGYQWYLQQFNNTEVDKVNVDFSVSYAYPDNLEQTVHRINQLIQDPKLFILIRNPIERAFSDYLRSIRLSEYPKGLGFLDACKRFPELINRGMYSKIIMSYHRIIPNCELKVFFYDDLLLNEEGFIRSIFDYFKVPYSDILLTTDNIELKGASIRFQWLNTFILKAKLKVDTCFKKLGYYDSWSNLKYKFLPSWQKLLSFNQQSSMLTTQERNILAPIFAEDIKLLENLQNRDLSAWYS